MKNTSSNFKYSFINKYSFIPPGASEKEKTGLQAQGILIVLQRPDRVSLREEYLWRFLTG